MNVDVSAWYDYPENPTVRNVERRYYNCGGYALGSYKWYLPYKDKNEEELVHDMFHHSCYRKADKLMVNNIFDDFPELVEIKESWVRDKLVDWRKFEIIAFRTRHTSWWDFHFLKLGANGRWYDKMGGDYTINSHKYNYVFNNWDYGYNGKIYFFARKRPR